jgi:hypothetical protein
VYFFLSEIYITEDDAPRALVGGWWLGSSNKGILRPFSMCGSSNSPPNQRKKKNEKKKQHPTKTGIKIMIKKAKYFFFA